MMQSTGVFRDAMITSGGGHSMKKACDNEHVCRASVLKTYLYCTSFILSPHPDSKFVSHSILSQIDKNPIITQEWNQKIYSQNSMQST